MNPDLYRGTQDPLASDMDAFSTLYDQYALHSADVDDKSYSVDYNTEIVPSGLVSDLLVTAAGSMASARSPVADRRFLLKPTEGAVQIRDRLHTYKGDFSRSVHL